MHRRHLILPAVPALLLHRPAQALGWGNRHGARRLVLRHASTGIRFAGTYHNGTAPDPVAMRELSRLLGDSRTGAIRDFDPRVLDILWELGMREGLQDHVVLSGYRTPESNSLACGAGNSQHLQACAIDIALPTAKLAAFAQAAVAMGRGGVGAYAQRGFIHLDSGPVRQWGDAGTAGRTERPDPIGRMAEAWRRVSGR